MKKILTLCYVSLAAAFILPLFLRAAPEAELSTPLTLPALSPAEAVPIVTAAVGVTPEASASVTEPVSPTAPPITAAARAESPARLSVLIGDEAAELDTADYLTGVVAAEMPAAFEPEALKAQAVAARTYAMYCAAQAKHGAAQVCTDSGCCQAYLGREAMRERWGAEYERYYEKIRAAVEATAGEYLEYEGAPVLAVFHSSSVGRTEDSGAVWGGARPYLVSVDSPESADTVPGYVSSVELSALDFRDTLLAMRPQADFSGGAASWIGECRRDESGRVESLALGGAEFSGTELRAVFKLRSTAFTLEYTGDAFLFTVTGYGHGVGMSQYGANLMAQQGYDYAQILAHYYPGAVLVSAGARR